MGSARPTERRAKSQPRAKTIPGNPEPTIGGLLFCAIAGRMYSSDALTPSSLSASRRGATLRSTARYSAAAGSALPGMTAWQRLLNSPSSAGPRPGHRGGRPTEWQRSLLPIAAREVEFAGTNLNLVRSTGDQLGRGGGLESVGAHYV
jgi:hypothetical protein